MNFLQETISDIKSSGHKPEDIIFIGSEESGYMCSWKVFSKLADRDYDEGFGCRVVPADLIIVFSDGSKMWRGEHDGSEWWNYSTQFSMPNEKKEIKNLFAVNCWDSIEDIYSGKGNDDIQD